MLLLSLDWLSTGRLILFVELRFRIQTMMQFGLEVRRGAKRRTEEIKQEEML